MHEVGIMQSILALAEEQARTAGAAEIHAIRLRIGRLAGVVRESLEFAFEALRPGTPAERASLAIDEVPASYWCAACQKEFEVAEWIAECPDCGGLPARLIHGREMELVELEIS
jgi:hydrogenase nickel incorporation protein HypA/HybF